ncbi:PAS domain S-box-containing protein [Roseiarcus fermentans]|uniref:histidine kinase n=1 Tax=Roseiarcus fermentans TaxID=1473586 RepID=A0A366EN29_9HYPH|nr:ATP-binding protein [Roseiarcus fermentans]RBP03110.1 PAS domain S-box-containing protein [Roseiarcus fermentans]
MTRGSDKRFRLAVEASPASMIMVDADGTIAFANAETGRMFGYPVDDLVGRSIDILVPRRARAGHAGLRQGFFAAPSKRPMGAGRDLYGTRQDGTEFPVEIGLTPIDAADGAIVLATIVDITARRKADLDLAQRASDLELANARLTQFAYVASHDLQEPLRKIAVYAGLLDEAIKAGDAAAAARATAIISGSAQRARRMVDNLLAFSRVGGAETQTRPLDLRAAIELALTDLSASIEETGAAIRLEVEPVVAPADPAQLGRLIQNIVSNAIKYRKPGAAPSITIRTERIGETRVRLSIADDGVGFDQKFATEIFLPFKRLHALADYPGSGIGLAICKAIADRYGWALAARSRPGQGSTFEVILPVEGRPDP